MQNKPRPSSGLANDDIIDMKVFLRTVEDALSCADIALKEAGQAHYKDYIHVLT